MTDAGWIEAALTAARPRAVGALLRNFRDLDTAEEAFQEACLRALQTWPVNGPPRHPAAWLVPVRRAPRPPGTLRPPATSPWTASAGTAARRRCRRRGRCPTSATPRGLRRS